MNLAATGMFSPRSCTFLVGIKTAKIIKNFMTLRNAYGEENFSIDFSPRLFCSDNECNYRISRVEAL